MEKNTIIKVYNTPSPNFIRLKFQDYVNIESFFPIEDTSEWDECTESERITIHRVREIISIQKERYARNQVRSHD